MSNNVTAVILAGGIGSRLWPLSRVHNPKQFISIDGDDSLLSNTLKRLPSLGIEKVIVICNFTHRFLVAETLRRHYFLGNNIILEPCGKNTAPAIALAALHIENSGHKGECMLVLAADHIINDCNIFAEAYNIGCLPAQQDKLVTFGVVPDYPETGYGYIEVGEELEEANLFKIKQFVEKPSLSLAQHYVDSKRFLWNSGMFLFKTNIYLKELKRHRGDIYNCCAVSYDKAMHDENFIKIPDNEFSCCAADSIDYAIMEKSSARVVVPLNAGWSDVGSWDSIWELSNKDSNGNAIKGDVLALESNNSYIRSENKLIATYGVNDLIVVDTVDALLITPRNQSQFVKNIFEALQLQGREECSSSNEEFRYWGSINNIYKGDDYRINLLKIEPGKFISYQVHKHRVECWYVLKGEACIRIDDEIKTYKSSETILIEPGCKHKIENSTSAQVIIIEVQHGCIKDELDIIRYN